MSQTSLETPECLAEFGPDSAQVIKASKSTLSFSADTARTCKELGK